MTPDLIRRFWAKVTKSEGCWEWQAATSRGYGQIGDGNGRLIYAHRLSYELANGPIPTDLCVLHHCDNRRCVRPSHLYAGTKLDNARDALVRGRMAIGERHSKAILTADQARAIRAAVGPARMIGPMFGISPREVSAIRAGERWRSLHD